MSFHFSFHSLAPRGPDCLFTRHLVFSVCLLELKVFWLICLFTVSLWCFYLFASAPPYIVMSTKWMNVRMFAPAFGFLNSCCVYLFNINLFFRFSSLLEFKNLKLLIILISGFLRRLWCIFRLIFYMCPLCWSKMFCSVIFFNAPVIVCIINCKLSDVKHLRSFFHLKLKHFLTVFLVWKYYLRFLCIFFFLFKSNLLKAQEASCEIFRKWHQF